MLPASAVIAMGWNPTQALVISQVVLASNVLVLQTLGVPMPGLKR